MDVRILVVDRKTQRMKYQFTCSKWNVEYDILSSTQSSFMVDSFNNYDNINTGDFLICKSVGERFKPTTKDTTWLITYYRPMYIGLIDSFEDLKITTRPLTEIFNMSLPLKAVWKDDNPSIFVRKIATDYCLTTDRYLGDFTIYSVDGNIDWSIVQDKPAVYNFLTMLQNLYKTTQFFVKPVGYSYDPGPKHFAFGLVTVQAGETDHVYFLDKNHYFSNVSVYIRPENVGNANAIRILYNDVLYSYYLTEDDRIVTDPSDKKLHTPVSKIGYVMEDPPSSSTSTEAPPTPAEVARRELKTQTYQHEITFEVSYDYPQVDYITTLGEGVTISYHGKRYKSVVTKWSASSDKDTFEITCGNVRSTLQFALDETYE